MYRGIIPIAGPTFQVSEICFFPYGDGSKPLMTYDHMNGGIEIPCKPTRNIHEPAIIYPRQII